MDRKGSWGGGLEEEEDVEEEEEEEEEEEDEKDDEEEEEGGAELGMKVMEWDCSDDCLRMRSLPYFTSSMDSFVMLKKHVPLLKNAHNTSTSTTRLPHNCAMFRRCTRDGRSKRPPQSMEMDERRLWREGCERKWRDKD